MSKCLSVSTSSEQIKHQLNFVSKPRKEITGLRLEPLVDLRNQETSGYEVLSDVKTGSVEDFFINMRTADVMDYTLWQLSLLSKIDMNVCFNLPVSVLLDTHYISTLLSSHCIFNKTIEIQDTENVLKLTKRLLFCLDENITSLNQSGCSVWLDDVKINMIDKIKSLDVKFNGAKTDRVEIMENGGRLKEMVHKLARFVPVIVIEGIENSSDLLLASASGANFGQGYKWKNININLANKRVL